MEIPGLGTVSKDDELGWYQSSQLPISVLGGKYCRIIVDGYDEDSNKEDFHVAIANFLSIDPSVLKEAEQHVFKYYETCKKYWDPEDGDFVSIKSPHDIWDHVQFGAEPIVHRRPYGDKGIYFSLECGCDWEEEHGLLIVFKNGRKVNKIGPYDGHCTNSDAYADASLENVVYR